MALANMPAAAMVDARAMVAKIAVVRATSLVIMAVTA